MVHIYVSQLRKVLPSGALQTRPPGYRLEVAPEAVDLLRFERLRKEGRAALADGDAATAAERLTAACALWRGPALGEFSEPFAAAAAAHLDELRLLAVEDRVDAELALGRHRDVAGELQALVASHPLRERPRRQLMLALYRQGRHAEALAAFQELRAALRDELGIDPSAGLAELQYRILNQDPALDHASPAPAPAAPRAGPGARAARRRRIRRPGGGAGAARAGARRSDGRARRDRADRRPCRHRQDAADRRAGGARAQARRDRAHGTVHRPGRRRPALLPARRGAPAAARHGRPRRTAGAVAPAARLAARRDRGPERVRRRSCTCSRRCARRSSVSAPPRRSCWCSRTCTGPTRRRSTCSPSWRTPCTTAACSSSPPGGRTRCARTTRCTGSPPGCGAAGSPSRWSSGRSRGTSSRRSSPARATAR